MENHYRLLALDIDGTVLDKNRVISPGVRTAIDKARAAGVIVALSTGRVAQGSLDVIADLALDGFHIFFDGALINNPNNGDEVFAQPIQRDVVRRAVASAHGYGLDIGLYSSERYFVEQNSWASDLRSDFYHTVPVVDDFNRVIEEERIIKAALTLSSDADRKQAKLFYGEFPDTLNISLTKTPAFPDIDFINVLAPGISKGKSLERLAGHFNIPMSQVMAVGDGPNDVSLLEAAGFAVAMGENAPDVLKELADFITLDVDHDGLALAINRFILRE